MSVLDAGPLTTYEEIESQASALPVVKFAKLVAEIATEVANRTNDDFSAVETFITEHIERFRKRNTDRESRLNDLEVTNLSQRERQLCVGYALEVFKKQEIVGWELQEALEKVLDSIPIKWNTLTYSSHVAPLSGLKQLIRLYEQNQLSFLPWPADSALPEADGAETDRAFLAFNQFDFLGVQSELETILEYPGVRDLGIVLSQSELNVIAATRVVAHEMAHGFDYLQSFIHTLRSTQELNASSPKYIENKKVKDAAAFQKIQSLFYTSYQLKREQVEPIIMAIGHTTTAERISRGAEFVILEEMLTDFMNARSEIDPANKERFVTTVLTSFRANQERGLMRNLLVIKQLSELGVDQSQLLRTMETIIDDYGEKHGKTDEWKFVKRDLTEVYKKLSYSLPPYTKEELKEAFKV